MDTTPKISTLSIRIIRITSHYLKYFESKSIFIDYYTIAPVFNTRSIIHDNTKREQISFSDYNNKTSSIVSKVSPKSSANSLINKAQHLEP